MATKFPAGRGVMFGLLVASLAVALVADVAEAGRKGRRARKALEAPAATQEEARPQAAEQRPTPEPDAARPEVARSDSNPADGLPPEQVAAIARAQRCWAELGYYKAEVDGKRGRATRAAFAQFKREHGLANENDILAATVQQKVAELCKTGQDGAPLDAANDPLAPQQGAEAAGPQTPSDGEAALATPEAGDPSGGDVAYAADGEAAEAQAQAAAPRLDLDCLGEDLVAVLRRAHGLGVDVPTCDRGCVMPPAGLPQAQIDAMQAAGSVVWCRSCVPISGQLPLSDVKRVERAGNVPLCPIP